MRRQKSWFTMSGILAVLALAVMLPAGSRAASKYKVLHRFKGATDGANPNFNLIFDAAGNLYGTTPGGGAHGGGTVFKLKPDSDGSWTENVLYSFCSNCGDAEYPVGGLVFDAMGNLYGTTGSQSGTVFKLAPNADGSWTESVLHSFLGGSDGQFPSAGLIFDAGGNLYGTTFYGGDLNCDSIGCGTVFKLAPNADGSWTESVLYRFTGGDGMGPNGGLIFDAAGNLYGTTAGGGTFGRGVVFKLASQSDRSWTESVLLSFNGANGAFPYTAGLIFDTAGNLYGTTRLGGSRKCLSSGAGCGVVFKLTPKTDGTWTESVLHYYADHPAANPYASLIFDAVGNLFGTTANDYSPLGDGVVFKMVPQSDGSWAFNVLHVFLGKPALRPYDSLVLDKAGNLYGTASECGSGEGCNGVVFEISP
jgi:uncharacterized repeat protein (TIGR03803 family)